MFTQNIINNYLQIPGIDGMLLALPEIFIFCSTFVNFLLIVIPILIISLGIQKEI